MASPSAAIRTMPARPTAWTGAACGSVVPPPRQRLALLPHAHTVPSAASASACVLAAATRVAGGRPATRRGTTSTAALPSGPNVKPSQPHCHTDPSAVAATTREDLADRLTTPLRPDTGTGVATDWRGPLPRRPRPPPPPRSTASAPRPAEPGPAAAPTAPPRGPA